MPQASPDSGTIPLSRDEVFAVLSLATDLGAPRPREHGLRTSLLAKRLGQALGLDTATLRQAYDLALLGLLGCTSTIAETVARFGDELIAGAALVEVDPARPEQFMSYMLRYAGLGRSPLGRERAVAEMMTGGAQYAQTVVATHCEVAQTLAERLGAGEPLRAALGQLYEHWGGGGLPNGLRGEQLALPVRIVQVAETAANLLTRTDLPGTIKIVGERSVTSFDPAVVDCFRANAAELCADLLEDSVWQSALEAAPIPGPLLGEAEIEAACLVMADFADLKSVYGAGHSRAVAALAGAAAAAFGLPPNEQQVVRRAAMLHDLGRVGVTGAIWLKPTPLTPAEWAQLRKYPGYGEYILERPRRLAPIAALVGLHAERLDGAGYPRGLPAMLLPQAARLLAAAHVFQALCEPRAHRPAFAPGMAARLLQEQVRTGLLDGSAVEAVLQVARPRAPIHRAWPAGLTAREVAVLGLLSQGYSMRQVAAQLTISERTVEHHVEHIYSKIGVSSRAAATLFAIQHGLVGASAQRVIPSA